MRNPTSAIMRSAITTSSFVSSSAGPRKCNKIASPIKPPTVQGIKRLVCARFIMGEVRLGATGGVGCPHPGVQKGRRLPAGSPDEFVRVGLVVGIDDFGKSLA